MVIIWVVCFCCLVSNSVFWFCFLTSIKTPETSWTFGFLGFSAKPRKQNSRKQKKTGFSLKLWFVCFLCFLLCRFPVKFATAGTFKGPEMMGPNWRAQPGPFLSAHKKRRKRPSPRCTFGAYTTSARGKTPVNQDTCQSQDAGLCSITLIVALAGAAFWTAL